MNSKQQNVLNYEWCVLNYVQMCVCSCYKLMQVWKLIRYSILYIYLLCIYSFFFQNFLFTITITKKLSIGCEVTVNAVAARLGMCCALWLSIFCFSVSLYYFVDVSVFDDTNMSVASDNVWKSANESETLHLYKQDIHKKLCQHCQILFACVMDLIHPFIFLTQSIALFVLMFLFLHLVNIMNVCERIYRYIYI